MKLRGVPVVAVLLIGQLSLTTSSLKARSAPPKQTRKPLPADVIDINRASAEDFEKLPGVGAELARRIVEYREKSGPFKRVEDLLVIRGIGPKKWKGIRPYVRVGAAARKSPS